MKSVFLTTLSSAINAYLGLDPESSQRMAALADKTIQMELEPFHAVFQLTFSKHGIHACEATHASPHTTIKGTPLQLAGMLFNKTDRQSFFADDVQMQGDAEVGQQVIELFDELQIDWEEPLSSLIGDIPAYHAGRMMRNLKRWLKQSDQSLTQNISDYVHEEAAMFPPREALHDFFNEIDRLRMDVDRADAQIQQLQSALINDLEVE